MRKWQSVAIVTHKVRSQKRLRLFIRESKKSLGSSHESAISLGMRVPQMSRSRFQEMLATRTLLEGSAVAQAASAVRLAARTRGSSFIGNSAGPGRQQ